MKPRSVHNILQQTLVNFWNDDCLSMAAAIAFYTIFSLPPLLVIAVSIASLVFEPEVVQSLVAKETAYVVGLDGAQQIQTLLVNANQIENTGKSSVFGLLVLVFGATSSPIRNALLARVVCMLSGIKWNSTNPGGRSFTA